MFPEWKTLLKGNEEEIEQEAEKCLREGGKEGYMLGASCDILPSTPIENIQMLERCRRPR